MLRAALAAAVLLALPAPAVEEPLEHVAHFEGRVERVLRATSAAFAAPQAACPAGLAGAAWEDQGEVRMDVLRAGPRLLLAVEYAPEVQGRCAFRAAFDAVALPDGWAAAPGGLAQAWAASVRVRHDAGAGSWHASYFAEAGEGQVHRIAGAVGHSAPG